MYVFGLKSLASKYPNGICLVTLRIAIGMCRGEYVMDPSTAAGFLAQHSAVKELAKKCGDSYSLMRAACKKAGLRLNDIFGDETKDLKWR